MKLVHLLTKQLEQDLNFIVKSKFGLELQVELKRPKTLEHGDLTTTSVLGLYPLLGSFKKDFTSPLSLAEGLIGFLTEYWQTLPKEKTPLAMIEKITVAKPGFINFWFTNKYLHQLCSGFTSDFIKKSLVDAEHKGKKVIVEFTDPNPFKEFHIGHLYSNVVGEAISRLQEGLGSLVRRACYQGDVGMHVAKSVWGMQKKARSIDSLLALSLKQKVKFLGEAYALGATAYEEDPQAKKAIQTINYYTFLAGQEYMIEHEGFKPQVDYQQYLKQSKLDYQEIKKLYQLGKQWSLEYFAGIYERLGMKFDFFFFESQVGEVGVKIVREFLKKHVFEASQGAVIFPGKKHGLHDRVFINSLGLPTYEAKELGLAPSKYERFAYDRSIIITGNEIDEYFKVLLKAMSFTHPDLFAKTIHLSHGMVRLPDGKMSSRTGKVITGEWLMDEAKGIIERRLDQDKPNLSAKKKQIIADQVAMGAIKYALLKSNIGGDISFSFKESLAFAGNSGPYLQYTAVRCFGVLRKAADQLSKGNISLLYDSLNNTKIDWEKCYTSLDKDVQRNLVHYIGIVKLATKENAPHQLATYLYNLAQLTNVWYDREKILDQQLQELSQEKAAKLLLARSILLVMTHGLGLMGISIPEEM